MPPDARDTDRVRQRCQQALAGQRRDKPRGDGWFFAAAAVYLITAIQQAIEFLR
jgi:hypothetical protein